MRILRAYALNIVALLLASVIAGVVVINGHWLGYAIIAAVILLLNYTLKPILKLVSAPLIGLTFGLFVIVINGFLLWLITYLPIIGSYLNFKSLSGLIITTFIISAANLVSTHRL